MLKHLKKFDFLPKLFVTLILVFVPLYIKFPFISLPGTYVSIRFEDFIIAFTFLVFGLFYSKDLVTLLKTKIGKSILFFWFIGFVSLLSAAFLTKTVNTTTGLLHLLRRIEYVSMFFIGFLYLKNSKKSDFKYILKLLLIVNFFIFLYGFGERYFNFPVITTQNAEYSKGVALSWISGAHINSTFAGHYDLASYIILTLPIFVNLLVLVRQKWLKILIGLSITIDLWLISVAASRISSVSLIVAVIFSLFLLKKYKEIIIAFIIGILVFGTSPDLRVRYMRIFDVVKEKISKQLIVYAQAEEVFEDRSTSIRLNVEWPRAIRAFSKNPLLGTGYSSITLATDNDYLRILGETGLLGLSSFSLIFLHILNLFKSKIKKLKRFSLTDQAFVAGFSGGITGALINATFIDIFEASKFAIIFWLFMGFYIYKLSTN